jgi:hypothetical protein
LNPPRLFVKIGKIGEMGKLSETTEKWGVFLHFKDKGIREMKEIRLLILFLVITLFVQNATAGLILPYSSHYQGRSYFDNTGVTGFIDFAVYDTKGLYNEWAGFASPGSGQYIYAYQIFVDVGVDAITSFSIMHTDTNKPLNIVADNMNTQNPWENSQLITEGVEPTNWGIGSSGTTAWWQFFTNDLLSGEYSWFLVFSSDKDWTVGKYEMQTAGGFPIAPNPEPATVVLLGLGCTILFAKRRNSAGTKSHRAPLHN